MLLIMMSHLKFLILFLCLTSVLTFSTKKSMNSSENLIDRVGPIQETNLTMNSTSVTYDPTVVASAPTKEIAANHTINKYILAEGGPVPVPKSSSLENTALADGVNLSFRNLTHFTRENTSNEENTKPSVVPRKGVEPKVVPWKWAGRMSDPLASSMEESEPDKNLNQNVSEDTTISSNMGSFVSKEYKFRNNITDLNSTRIFSTTNFKEVNKTIEAGVVTPQINATQAPKRHKPKPTATVGGSDEDKPIPASPTKTSPLGMPRKIDYIVPVVITIMAVPLLGLAAFVLYRRGRDCWDKRHYRRMDFLIDGMYNDWSSKGHAFPDSE
ncbi:uncharacterized protein LOC107270246 [Cephus cinctus]|uniref:Uncharacterized protein LOC107270246 n=1 Tax=Cephus cinctus TaxID=211228 RepID=A0AAJ7C2S1_CEPCN|nr:uncharacterized protein LOC107270246 [Cephus cinctus]